MCRIKDIERDERGGEGGDKLVVWCDNKSDRARLVTRRPGGETTPPRAVGRFLREHSPVML
jgi:hypothetical protein